jgi:hypothetical protein
MPVIEIDAPPRAGGGAGARGEESQLAGGVSTNFTTGIGKGLREPCDPYREAYVFGAELGTPDASHWNCVPEIVEPAFSFDLSIIEPNHEVVVALLAIYNIPSGASHNVRFRWYRDGDNVPFFEFSYTIPDPGKGHEWVWAYVYSYVGYIPSEIYQNGNYHVDILWDGAAFPQIPFTISGIPEAYAGTISTMELEYDSVAWVGIPASNIPQNKTGRVHIWGRNDMATTQRLGIYWIIKDPDGVTVEEYSAWEDLPYTSPGSEHEFIGGRFTFGKIGTYTINAGLLMNPDSPVYVDMYSGTLCTVVAPPAGGVGVLLKAGGNYVVYTGKAQPASTAFASIMSYLDPKKVVYYWNNVTGLHEQVVATTTMVPYGVYWIEVIQDCTWTYGPEETAPTSVQLYGRWNFVPYLGPAQAVEDAFASIADYLLNWYYFDNITKNWENPAIMVPNGVYAVNVSQSCVWPFVAAAKGELVSAFVWWEGKEAWNPIGETNNWPAKTAIATAWKIKNTGGKTAFFKVKFMGLESSAVQLSPSDTATLYLYPTTPSPGTYDYTLSIIADDQVVKTYPIQVTTVALTPEFSGFGISDYSKV